MSRPRESYRHNRAQLDMEEDKDWQELVGFLAADLEESARRSGALVRRRGVRRAEDLLRIVLGYALLDWSLRVIAAWASVKELADISDTAVRERLKGAKVWLGGLVAGLVVRRQAELLDRDVRLRLIDATVVSALHSKGTDWRIHLSYDLGQGCFDEVELTGPEGGESLTRHEARPGEIVVADRGYCHRRGAGRLLSKGGGLVLRISLQNMPLADEKGKPMDVLAWLRGASTEAVERAVLMASPEGTFRLRLVARRLSEEAAEKARRKLRESARKKGRTPDKRGLEAASFITVLTNLDEDAWDAREILAVYRLRWQVEMAIKRLKGVLSIDHLRANDPELCQTYLLAKLLGALLIDRLSGIEGRLEADWALRPERPVSPWRHLVLWSEAVKRAVQGRLALSSLITKLDRLRRYLCDAPRRRKQLFTLGRSMANMLSKLSAGYHDALRHCDATP